MNDTSRNNTVTHLPNGRFAPNNGGRPKGSRNRISSEAIAAVKSMSDEALLQLRGKLIAGDWLAITFVLERILPKGRTFEIDKLSPEAVHEMLTAGEISSAEARDIATALAKLKDIGELETIRLKLDELERLLTK